MNAIADVAPQVDVSRRFGGLARLYGADGAARIRAAHVVVIGIGGVGSWAAEALARSGVGRLTLIDLDHIAESNINRQIHALDGTLGQAKVLAMQDRIANINPACSVKCVEEFVDFENWPAVAMLDESDKGAVCVIDACDNVKAKVAMAAWSLRHANLNARRSKALRQSTYFISVGAAGGKRLAHRVEIDDLSQTTHDPLLAQLRYRLRKEQGASRDGRMGISCVFSREAVAKPIQDSDVVGSGAQAENNLSCHGYGSVVSVTATFGICAAGWALDQIAG